MAQHPLVSSMSTVKAAKKNRLTKRSARCSCGAHGMRVQLRSGRRRRDAAAVRCSAVPRELFRSERSSRRMSGSKASTARSSRNSAASIRAELIRARHRELSRAADLFLRLSAGRTGAGFDLRPRAAWRARRTGRLRAHADRSAEVAQGRGNRLTHYATVTFVPGSGSRVPGTLLELTDAELVATDGYEQIPNTCA